ncbi:hypothetical protein [Clostridium sp. Marseille-P299]|uniref:hypothetical protein n=1 Tax=Clostridium sp. Marseille-P299 TaxID=1805477 RepID=UPI000836584E|nr:hypothetical protein [Clostridium sp. Marseille-P299]
MKIAFWSNDRNAGVTANLAAISVIGLHEGQKKTLLLENHYSSNNLARYLFPSRMELLKEVEVYYLGRGTRDCLVQQLERGTNKKRAELSTIELINDSLFYLPQNRLQEDFFDYEFQWNQLPLINQFEEKGHNILIDTKVNNSMSSKTILDEADLVVVSLRQDIRSFTEFFHDYSSLLHKTFFIVSDYRHNREVTISHIQKRFAIPHNRISIILHNIEFESALFEGRVIEFINRHINCNNNDPNFEFINELINTTRKIMFINDYSNYGKEVVNLEKRGI